MMYPSGSTTTPVPRACCRTIRAVSVCPCSSDGPYPVTTIWTTDRETFETTVSRELSKALSKFDGCAFETGGAAESVRAAADCASTEVATKKQAMTPYFVHCNVVIMRRALLNPGFGA